MLGPPWATLQRPRSNNASTNWDNFQRILRDYFHQLSEDPQGSFPATAKYRILKGEKKRPIPVWAFTWEKPFADDAILLAEDVMAPGELLVKLEPRVAEAVEAELPQAHVLECRVRVGPGLQPIRARRNKTACTEHGIRWDETLLIWTSKEDNQKFKTGLNRVCFS